MSGNLWELGLALLFLLFVKINDYYRLNCGLINYVEKLKYLGCVLVSAKSVKVGLHETRIKFFKSFNLLYSKSCKLTEPVLGLLHLINTYFKPFLLF